MDVVELGLPEVLLIKPRVFRDKRGLLIETYQEKRYMDIGIKCRFVQDNHSISTRGTLRGLHYQAGPGQAKLIRVARGRIFDVAVDIRRHSETFGCWVGAELDDVDHFQVYVPAGFAHGFVSLSDEAHVSYKLSRPYDSNSERSLLWNDPELDIRWPVSTPLLSERDRDAMSFSDYKIEERR